MHQRLEFFPSFQPVGCKTEPRAEAKISWKASMLMKNTCLSHSNRWITACSFSPESSDKHCNWQRQTWVWVWQHLCLSVSLPLWQSEGTLLATGSYDGFARIWTKDGEMIWISCIVEWKGGMLHPMFLRGGIFLCGTSQWHESSLKKLMVWCCTTAGMSHGFSQSLNNTAT